MTLREQSRLFFVLYDNGDTFYFAVNGNCEIYCTKFKNIYENTRKQTMPGAASLEFVGNSFNLKNASGETIYSLEEYNKDMSKYLSMPKEIPSIERLYIDEDVRTNLLSLNMLTFDEKASLIPGLLTDEQQQSYTRTRCLNRK